MQRKVLVKPLYGHWLMQSAHHVHGNLVSMHSQMRYSNVDEKPFGDLLDRKFVVEVDFYFFADRENLLENPPSLLPIVCDGCK